MFSNCDGTGIPPSTTNVKFVADSSEFSKYKKQVAITANYNDSSFGGDEHNASFISKMGLRRMM